MSLNIPKTIMCKVSSVDILKALCKMPFVKDEEEKLASREIDGNETDLSSDAVDEASLVLAGLHACGDLSVTMLKYVPDVNLP